MNLFAFRKKLFFKIFLWFWLTNLAVNLMFLIISMALQTDSVPANWRILSERAVKFYAQNAVEILNQKGADELENYLENLERETQIESYLLDKNGVSVNRRALPANFSRVFTQTENAPGIEVKLNDLTNFTASQVTDQNGNQFIFLAKTPRYENSAILDVGWQTRLIRLPLVVFVSGLVCLWLARRLTRPIIKLSATARQLADGDLSARSGAAELTKNEDELANLSRNFDAMAEKLEEKTKAQKRLFADISHELRSPLARINIAAELARGTDKDETEDSLVVIEKETEKFGTLISQILTLAKLENSPREITREKINLTAMLEKIAADSDFEACARNCRVVLQANPNCLIQGDERLLHSAIENVVRNAIYYTREKTTVEIFLEIENKSARKKVLIRVRDFGKGVPESELVKMFEPFYRVEESREEISGGTGLGLAIAKQHIESHGGKIAAQNLDGGGGFEVVIELPIN